MSARHARVTIAAVAAALGLVAVSCTSSNGGAAGPSTTVRPTASTSIRPAPPSAPVAVVEPGAAWTPSDPRDLGFDPARLAAIAALAKAADSDCFAVVRHGRMVGQWYWKGSGPTTTHEVFSATKSFTSTLVGLAQADGKLRISDLASTYIPQWKGTASAGVTVRDLISNDSGRHWDFRSDYVDMAVRARDKNAFAIGLGQDVPPGTRWVYNNSAIQTLSQVLRRATGVEAADYAEQRIFLPIGMASTSINKDLAGHTLTFMGVQSTCGDMARYGELMLRQGRWNGRPVVPASWVAAATGQPSTPLNAGYGYLWWLNRPGRQAGGDQATGGNAKVRAARQRVPSAPADMYWALGLGNQIIQIDPSSDTVVVRIGPGVEPKGVPGFGQDQTAAVVTQALTR